MNFRDSQSLDKLSKRINALATAARDDAGASANRALNIARTTMLGTLAAIVLLTAFVVRSITGSLARLTSAARSIAAGKVDIEGGFCRHLGPDELGLLATAFREMALNLRACRWLPEAVAGGDLRSTNIRSRQR